MGRFGKNCEANGGISPSLRGVSFTSKRSPATGFLYALLAYASWGLFPLYWKYFGGVSPLEIVSHRVLWSVLLLALLVAAGRQMREVMAVLQDWRHLLVLLLTASLLSANWGIFIYGVLSGRVVQTSLGYFLNPLISILLALVFLKERLNRWQTAALVLAACGVAHFGWHLGHFPWIAIGLASTFGLYGLLRKVVRVSPLVGLLVETALMTPAALGMIAVLSRSGQAAFGASTSQIWLFASMGVITTLPLLWFNKAAKLLRLSTMGFLQYLVPTLQLLVGVIVFHEPFTRGEGVSFALIWAAIVIYLSSHLRQRTR